MDWRELQKYRPIPRGGLILLAGVAVIALACVGIGFLLEKRTTVMWAWMSAGGSFSVMLIVCAFVLGIGDYLRRNVRGYTLWGWRDENGEVRWEATLILPYDLAIGVALGGWFRRSRITCSAVTFREGVNSKRLLSQWRVKLVRIHVNTQTAIVRLIDRDGDRVTVSTKGALEILERFSARLEVLTNTWHAVVSHGLIAERVRTEERDEALRQRELAFLAMLRVNAAIKETSRFQKSKEARRIRKRLIRDLLEIVPVDHPFQNVLREEQTGSQPPPAAPAATEAREGG